MTTIRIEPSESAIAKPMQLMASADNKPPVVPDCGSENGPKKIVLTTCRRRVLVYITAVPPVR
jgi:hypothetical protein